MQNDKSKKLAVILLFKLITKRNQGDQQQVRCIY